MTNLSPVDQITAMKDGNARKIFKATRHQIVILLDTADTGIGIETWNYRIRIGNDFFHSSVLFPCLSLKERYQSSRLSQRTSSSVSSMSSACNDVRVSESKSGPISGNVGNGWHNT